VAEPADGDEDDEEPDADALAEGDDEDTDWLDHDVVPVLGNEDLAQAVRFR
jgi:hypothetical protein